MHHQKKTIELFRGYKGSLIDPLVRNKIQIVFIIITAFSDCRKMHSLSLIKRKTQEKRNLSAFLCPF